ncbi:rab GTPase-binding effector protein 2 isoform X1 [Tachysurus fulvidraco]|uniref:rab GTPase-binding effector protein 2 isoform X1 n=1 Tax=Tachysurus fulvidraco TaxID=1234273 RepID=UPI001FEFC60C|nr:rab GTPase-binding effector protein 2 isoform X1 [Tachysurus fulvidraco]
MEVTSKENSKSVALPDDEVNIQLQLLECRAQLEHWQGVAKICELSKQEELQDLQRQCDQEIQSLHEAIRETASQYEARISALQSERSQWRRAGFTPENRDSVKKGRIESGSPPSDRLKNECAAGDGDSRELLAEPSDAESTGLHMEGFYTQQCDSSSLSCFSLDTPSLPRRMPPQDDTASLVSTGTLVPEAIYLPPPGHHLVTHADWDGLHAQVAELQEELTHLKEQKAQLEKELDIQTTETKKQVAVLQSQAQTSETLLQELQKSFSQAQSTVQSRLKELSLSQRRVCSELSRLKGGEMEESTAGDEHSELFTLQGAHTEERLRIEIVNLREQLEMRTEESEVLEVQLSSLKTETDRIQSDKEKLEGELQESRTELQGLRVALSHLQRDIKTQSHDKTVLHGQCLELRSQVISLRSQLDTSQAVQRDFVQLSQSLQVKMEQIRQAESLDQVRRVLGEPLEEESDQLSSAT